MDRGCSSIGHADMAHCRTGDRHGTVLYLGPFVAITQCHARGMRVGSASVGPGALVERGLDERVRRDSIWIGNTGPSRHYGFCSTFCWRPGHRLRLALADRLVDRARCPVLRSGHSVDAYRFGCGARAAGVWARNDRGDGCTCGHSGGFVSSVVRDGMGVMDETAARLMSPSLPAEPR